MLHFKFKIHSILFLEMIEKVGEFYIRRKYVGFFFKSTDHPKN